MNNERKATLIRLLSSKNPEDWRVADALFKNSDQQTLTEVYDNIREKAVIPVNLHPRQIVEEYFEIKEKLRKIVYKSFEHMQE